MAISDAAGKPDVRMVDLIKASSSEVRQIVASDHIRDIGEQRAWIDANQNIAKDTPAA